MFESLTSKLQAVFQQLGRRGKLRPEDVDAALREIRLALLDADVHYQVVKRLLSQVRERTLSEEVAKALNPAQQVVRAVHDSLVEALGDAAPLRLRGPRPRPVLLVGLQGSGKTTTAAKLARRLKARGERVWLIAADPYRPAAAEQLSVLGEEAGIAVYHQDGLTAMELAERGCAAAGEAGASVAIIDTAGRSELDDALMQELGAIAGAVSPSDTLLIADAMTGQDAVHIAQGFLAALPLGGLILTKMDGDARGGAAISMRSVTGVPIKFLGVGEGRADLESFDPQRLASRILGMGDIQGMIERAEQALDAQDAGEQATKLLAGEFSLEDFLRQLEMIAGMGPLGKLIESLPAGLARGANVDKDMAQRQLKRTQAILRSMTRRERAKPEILNASRKRRIAAGSGTTVQELNQLLRQYKQMRKMMKQIGKRGLPNLGSGLF